MPWVRLDDRFPSHRKIRLLSDRAFRLYVSALCWSSENLTDGVIPAQELRIVADIRSCKAAAKELVERGLWENTDNGDFLIHDYLDFNPSAEQVRAEREAKTARQARWRANKKGTKKAPATPSQSADVDASTAPSTDASHDAPVAPAPYPSPSPVPPTEVQLASPTASADVPMIGDRPRIPDASRPLVDALTTAGIVVGWDLAPADWILIEALIRRCGVDVLVQHAASAWHGARTRPRSGRYFLPGWRSLPDVPRDTPATPYLPAAVGFTTRPSTTDQRVQQGLALAARLRALEEGPAQ